jgi:hypothetical protein
LTEQQEGWKMGKLFIIAVALTLISLRPAVAGTEIIHDYGAEAAPPPPYNYTPPPPTVYYAPAPVRVVVRPVRVFRVFAFHRVARPRPYCAPALY